MLHICTWWWRTKFSEEYLVKLAHSVKRHMRDEPYKFHCITTHDQYFPRLIDEGAPIDDVVVLESPHYFLLEKPGCLVRLLTFNLQFQNMIKARPGDRIVNIDLDFVITGDLFQLFDRPEDFVILQGANMYNPCPFNGALFMLRAGAHQEVWNDFSLEAVAQVPFHEYPDDQGWLWHKIPQAAAWPVGPKSGVYVYKKRTWPSGDDLPQGAKMVTFVGKKNPKDLSHLIWVKQNWRV